MKGKKAMRVAVDVALTLMIVFEMFIQYTGNFLHEVIGFAFFATVMAHLLLSAKWMKGTAKAVKKGTMTGRRTALTIVDVLLAVDIVALGVSSVAISGLLADAGLVWSLGSYALWASVHSVTAYALCALVALHLGMHWVFLASAFRVSYDPSRRRAISTGVHVAAAAGALALGVMAVGKALPRTAVASESSQSDGDAFADSVSDVSGQGTASSSATSTGSSSSTGSTSAASPKGKKGKSNSMGSSSGSASSQSSAPSATNSGSSSSGSSSAQAPSGGSSGSGSSSGVSGTCTLCRKQCPLSAPQCDRPYQEGLL